MLAHSDLTQHEPQQKLIKIFVFEHNLGFLLTKDHKAKNKKFKLNISPQQIKNKVNIDVLNNTTLQKNQLVLLQ